MFGLTNIGIGIYSHRLIREGTSPEAFARRDEVAAPARGGFAPTASGRPGVTVRANYVALPLLTAGRGQDERGRKPAGSGTRQRPSCPGSTVPSPQIAAMERRKATRFLLRTGKRDKTICALRRSVSPHAPGRCFRTKPRAHAPRGRCGVCDFFAR
jgi:hypothetical protein